MGANVTVQKGFLVMIGSYIFPPERGKGQQKIFANSIVEGYGASLGMIFTKHGEIVTRAGTLPFHHKYPNNAWS